MELFAKNEKLTAISVKPQEHSDDINRIIE